MRKTKEEVVELAVDEGIVRLRKGESVAAVGKVDGNGNLPFTAKGSGGKTRELTIKLTAVRRTLNIEAYWEKDPYMGGEDFLIVPMD
jgi:hypothetical protein